MGAALKAARESFRDPESSTNLSRRELARRLYMSHSNLADYENGHRFAPAEVVQAYERELGLAPGSLVDLWEQARVQLLGELRTRQRRWVPPVATPRLPHERSGETDATDVPKPSGTGRRRWHRRAGSAVVLLAIVGALVILIREMNATGGPAGGINGQQISYCSGKGSAHGTAYVSGPNQAGEAILSHAVSLGDACGLQTGWWWVGKVRIVWYDSRGQYVGITICNIPKRQKARDWVTCYAPS